MANTLYKKNCEMLLPCFDLDKVRDVIYSGDWFKIRNTDRYFHAVPFETWPGTVCPRDVLALAYHCVTARTISGVKFFQLSQTANSQREVLYGDKLKESLIEEVKLWTKALNLATGKAPGGKSFESFLRAIPGTLLADEEFCQAINQTFEKAIKLRAKELRKTEKDQLENVLKLKDTVKEITTPCQLPPELIVTNNTIKE